VAPDQNALPMKGSMRPQNITPTHRNREAALITFAETGASSSGPKATDEQYDRKGLRAGWHERLILDRWMAEDPRPNHSERDHGKSR
jgi:hypothetical protein